MKVTFKGIAANVVTVKFTLACKCHVLADFQKKCQFLEKTQICQKFHTGFGRVFSVSNFLIHNLPGNIKNNANAKGYLRPLGFQFNLS